MDFLLIVLLVLLNGGFAMGEMALAASRKARLAAMAESGDKGAIAALALLPWLARRLGNTRAHALCLIAGALGLGSFMVLHDPMLLIASEIGVGMAWASILGMPYTILASSLPQSKLGVYMGLFNGFVVVPQLLVSTLMGSILKLAFPGQPVWSMAFGAGALVIAAGFSLRLRPAA